MGDLRITAQKLLNDLGSINSGDLKMKVRLEGNMKTIINLSDEKILSKEINDLETIVKSNGDIVKVYTFFINYPELEEKARLFFDE